MTAEVIVSVQIALVLLWAAASIGRELLKLKRAREKLAYWTAKITEEMRPEPEPEAVVVAEEPAPEPKATTAGTGGHRGKRGKKTKRRK